MKAEIELTEYQYNIHKAVTDSDVKSVPHPWKKIVSEWIECVVAAGFSRDERYIICTDGIDRWLYELSTGEVIEDSSDAEADIWWSDATLSIAGFGPILGENIRTSGVYGNAAGFYFSTSDGWCLTDFRSPYFRHHIILERPGQNLFGTDPSFTKIHETATTLVTYGFTPNGNNLFIAERDDIAIYTRS